MRERKRFGGVRDRAGRLARAAPTPTPRQAGWLGLQRTPLFLVRQRADM